MKAVEEEKNNDDNTIMGKATTPATPKEQAQQTQALIRKLYDVSSSEFMTPSVGDPYSVKRDPHLRLRRTLTPSLNVGIPKYTEAQFMLSKADTTGKRMSLQFGVSLMTGRRRIRRNTLPWTPTCLEHPMQRRIFASLHCMGSALVFLVRDGINLVHVTMTCKEQHHRRQRKFVSWHWIGIPSIDR